MRIVTKRDIISALTTGLTTGVIGWLILGYLGKSLPLGINAIVLVPVVPVLWVIGVQFGYFLGTIIQPFNEFGKFAAIGFANAMVDFGVLYLFIALTGEAQGPHYPLFKTISFSVATVHSYIWNKYWTFEAGKKAPTGRELGSFLVVSVLSLLVNVIVASASVHIGPADHIDPKAWAGISAAIGSAAALIFNFIGLKFLVFRKK